MGVLEQFSLKGKVALVTGGRTGLGRAFAVGLAEAGADVACFSRGASKETVDDVEKAGRKGISIRGDVSEEKDVRSAVERTVSELGGLDILVNNAGMAHQPNPVHLLSVEDWDKVVSVNLRGVFLFCKEALKVMTVNKKGKIINVASIWGLVGSASIIPVPAYNATKAAIVNLTRELALEYADAGITANCLAPAFFRSGLGDGAYDDPQFVRMAEASIPLGKIGDADDLNGTIVYMASQASDYMTGHTLVVDMGYTAV